MRKALRNKATDGKRARPSRNKKRGQAPELEKAVQRARKGLMQPLPPEMTANEAAEFLDVARPFVIALVKRGELPCRKAGNHRRIPSAAVVEYRNKMLQQARHAADEMSQLAQEAGLYDDEPPQIPAKVQ